MKKAACVVLLAVIVSTGFPSAGSAAVNLAIGMSASDISLGEALLVAGVASFLGFDVTVVRYYNTTARLPLPSVLTALLFSRMFGVDHHRLTAWRAQGHGWGRIARDLGVHPGAFNKLRKDLDITQITDDDFERLVVVWYLSQHYGVAQDRVYGWQRAGQPLLSILTALDLGAKSRRSVNDLFSARKYLASWDRVADKVGVGKAARRRPQKPKGGQEFRGGTSDSRDRGGQGSGSRGKGRGHGRGKGR